MWNEKFVFVFWARRCSDHTCSCGNWAREELFPELVTLKPVSSQSSQVFCVLHSCCPREDRLQQSWTGLFWKQKHACCSALVWPLSVLFPCCRLLQLLLHLACPTWQGIFGYFCFFLLNQTIKLSSPKLCWQHCIFPAELKVFLTCRSKSMCLMPVYLCCLAMHALILLCCNPMDCRQPQAAQLPTVLQLCHSAEGDSDSVPDMPSGVWADWGESLLNLPLLSTNTSSTRFTALTVASLLKDSLSFRSLT